MYNLSFWRSLCAWEKFSCRRCKFPINFLTLVCDIEAFGYLHKRAPLVNINFILVSSDCVNIWVFIYVRSSLIHFRILEFQNVYGTRGQEFLSILLVRHSLFIFIMIEMIHKYNAMLVIINTDHRQGYNSAVFGDGVSKVCPHFKFIFFSGGPLVWFVLLVCFIFSFFSFLFYFSKFSGVFK